MLSIFVEANCNRYVRDECQYCHVYEPLSHHIRADWHLMPEQAEIMAEKIRALEILKALAEKEITLTGGEPSQNPHIVEVFKIFQSLSPNIRLHTNLDLNSSNSPRWERMMEIIKLSGRIDITLYPTVWETRQKPLLQEIIHLQNELIVNVICENLQDLLSQIEILKIFFGEQESKFRASTDLLERFHEKLTGLLEEQPNCSEEAFLNLMEGVTTYTCEGGFIFALNIIPGFYVDSDGRRAMGSLAFPKDIQLLECTAMRGNIEIMTIRQTGEMTPCCDVGNLKCQPLFGNLLTDSVEKILGKFEISRKIMLAGALKNQENLRNNKAGKWVEEGIPPYCV